MELNIIPGTLIIKETIRPLLELLCDSLRLFMPLKPCLVLLMKTPALAFEGLRRHVLLIGVLSIIEDVKQGVLVHFGIKGRIIHI